MLKKADVSVVAAILATLLVCACDKVAEPELTANPENTAPMSEESQVLSRVRSIMTQDALYLHAMVSSGTSATFQEKFGMPFTGDDVNSWIGKRVKTIIYSETALPKKVTPIYNEKGQLIGQSTVGAVAANLSGDAPETYKTFVIGPMFVDNTYPQINRIGVMLHEARHSDGFEMGFTPQGGHPHAICPPDFSIKGMRGVAACEDNLEGSYSFQALFLKEVGQHCTSCSSLVKKTAGISFDDTVSRHLNPDHRKALQN